ncbi:unnamed protein product [Prunus armeniaca]
MEALKRTEKEEGVFEDLGITDEDMERSYLAAFLACWLCKFVFPKDDVTLIRPGVFKVASRMAHGVSFGLAVPVLASIYKGLNDISSADDPGNCTTILPFHYVYGWLGEYFDTHFTSSSEKSIPIMARFSGRLSAKFFEDSSARALFRTCGKVKMSRLARIFSECKQLTDEDHISKEDFEKTTESSNLIARTGSVDNFVMYNMCHENLKMTSGMIGSASTITLPTKNNIREFEVTSDYVIWWSKVHRFESTKSKTVSTVGKSSSLSQPRSLKSQGHEVSVHDKLTRGRALQVHPEVEGSSTTPAPQVQHLLPVDVPSTQVLNDKGKTESVADSQEDFIPLGRRIRRLKRGRVSSNEDSEVNFRHKKTSIEPLYCDLDTAYPLDDTFFCDVPAISQPVLMNEGEVVHHVPTVSELVPFNHFPIEEENDDLCPLSGSGVSLRGADVSSLRAMIDALMVTAVDYCSTHSAYSQKLSPEVQSDRLAAVDSSLSVALALQQAEEVHQFSILESIKSANTRMEELKREQEQLESRLRQLNESLSKSDAELSYHHGEVARLREDKIAVEEAPVLSTADAETLDALRVSFERLRNGFKDLSWE